VAAASENIGSTYNSPSGLNPKSRSCTRPRLRRTRHRLPGCLARQRVPRRAGRTEPLRRRPHPLTTRAPRKPVSMTGFLLRDERQLLKLAISVIGIILI
jgi:hypothetical protein